MGKIREFHYECDYIVDQDDNVITYYRPRHWLRGQWCPLPRCLSVPRRAL